MEGGEARIPPLNEFRGILRAILEPRLGDNRVLCGRCVRQKNRQLHRANPGKGGA